MKATEFIEQYGKALASQDWTQVVPLMANEICVTFSNGSVHRGISEVEKAYRRNFDLFQNEKYETSEIHWVKKDETLAIYLFKYEWTALMDGKEIGGQGHGTAVIEKQNGKWKLVAEHLGI